MWECGSAGARPGRGLRLRAGGGETGGGVASTFFGVSLSAPVTPFPTGAGSPYSVGTQLPRCRHCFFLWDSPTGTGLEGPLWSPKPKECRE